jgi:hypothetical protein
MAMNQDMVKEKLDKLHNSTVTYTVIFSGKKSNKVNGLYKPLTCEIIIHNKNFVRDGELDENNLMFTAIHEVAHHVVHTVHGKKGGRAHTALFWSTFYDLLDKSESLGIYHAEIDTETQQLIDEARDISIEIAGLQRKLGGVLVRLEDVCQQTGLRREDLFERKAQIAKQTAKVAIAAYNMNEEGLGVDLQTEAAKQKDDDKRSIILGTGREGKAIVQAKSATTAPARNPDETVSLIKEKRRIERTIESLTHRLEELNEQLKERNESE